MVNEKATYEPVLAFIHTQQEININYLAIDVYSTTTNTSSTLLVSPNHPIFDYDSDDAQFAGKFQVGNRLQLIHDNKITSGEIQKIRLNEEEGFYAPITPSGTIVVDGVVASNYASVSNHGLSHKMMGLYRWWIKLVGTSTKPSTDIPWLLHGMSYVELLARWCGIHT